ncbi:MAG: biopolymer transporter ExbD [Candidatus Omnitrophica bacterium]|nr:biopolymer transporter ExbD [Candidatus Omnitrophota bacterium]
MLRKPKRQRVVTDINITPFTDVVLVLLIIFMLTTPIIYQLNVKVKLPHAKNVEPTSRAVPVMVNITVAADGLVYLNNSLISVDDLEKKIKEIREYSEDIQAFLYSDKTVKFENVVGVLDILVKGGISDLHIAAVNEKRSR